MDKAVYWQRRKDGQRGQEDVLVKFYPKGTVVLYTRKSKRQADGSCSEPVEAEYPNASGMHMVRVRSKGLTYLSRREARKRAVVHAYTKPNYGYQKKKLGTVHAVSQPGQGKQSRLWQKLRPSFVTNHIAHRERQVTRSPQVS
jgi:hypothetical protein